MAAKRTAKAGLIPVGFQAMALSNSTAVALNSTIRANASVLDIDVVTAAARYRADATDPTSTTGVLLPVGWYRWEGYNGTANLKFIQDTGTSNVTIFAWRHAGGTR